MANCPASTRAGPGRSWPQELAVNHSFPCFCPLLTVFLEGAGHTYQNAPSHGQTPWKRTGEALEMQHKMML